MRSTGSWLKSYIGNQIIEKEEGDSTDDSGMMKSPLKDYYLETDGSGGVMKELITTERFLYDDDLKRNPYLFESDEFVRQKFLENRYREYEGVEINN